MSKEAQSPPGDKSEILFLYESSYSIPNGDPFTGEQRYDEETKKILVSDVRMKRYIRDYLAENKQIIYVLGNPEGGETSSTRYKKIKEMFKDSKTPIDVILNCIDVRLFGAVVAIKDDKGKSKKDEGEEPGGKKEKAFNVTGPVQFALLNPSLNAVDLRMHQNTSVFSSTEEKTRGAIGTTTVVPYALNQIHGWINPYSARETHLTAEDIKLMLQALWNSVNNANTRTKSNQNSLLLLQIVYADPTKKLYYLDKLISLTSSTKATQEQIREFDDYTLDFSKLKEAVNSDKVREVKYHTDHDRLKQTIQGLGSKFKEMGI